jgi:hypothetical protein
MEHAELIKRLEAERNDISYRIKEPKPIVQIKVKEVKRVPERLKKIYFHAGRYAAGDRDIMAVQAWTQYAKQEGIE